MQAPCLQDQRIILCRYTEFQQILKWIQCLKDKKCLWKTFYHSYRLIHDQMISRALSSIKLFVENMHPRRKNATYEI